MNKRDHEWLEYYDAFPYFSAEHVRNGCHPRKFENSTNKKSVVLVHGLTDSPYYLVDIATYFHEKMGFNVYLPLLHSHGLKEISSMKGVQLSHWEENVHFAMETAAAKNDEVAIGGFSMGAALALLMAFQNPQWQASLFLFSACMKLAGGVVGKLKHLFLLSPFLHLRARLDKTPLVGLHPFRYDRIDMYGAKELGKLLSQLNGDLPTFSLASPQQIFFAAHSQADTTASFTKVESFINSLPRNQAYLYRIAENEKVSHSGLVLRETIYATGTRRGILPLEMANPFFKQIMKEMDELYTS